MISENVQCAVQNFVLSFYHDGDVISAYDAGCDFLDDERELSEFDSELLNYLNRKSSIVVEGYTGEQFFPITLGVSGDLRHLISYLEEKGGIQ